MNRFRFRFKWWNSFPTHKSIMPIRLHALPTYHIWLVVQKYAAPGTEFLTSILDNLVKINNLYPLTICHNPVANMQKKNYKHEPHEPATGMVQISSVSTTSRKGFIHELLLSLVFFSSGHTVRNVSSLNRCTGGINEPALVQGLCQWIFTNIALTRALDSFMQCMLQTAWRGRRKAWLRTMPAWAIMLYIVDECMQAWQRYQAHCKSNKRTCLVITLHLSYKSTTAFQRQYQYQLIT